MGKLADAAPRAITMPGDTRASIVAALGAVPGLVPSANVPDVPTPGAAWPAWVQTTFAGTLARPGIPAYDVYVLLPAGYRADTVEQGDSLLALVADALWPLGQLQLAEPVTVRFDSSQTMPGLRVRLVMKGN
jgi:hypothetical protein